MSAAPALRAAVAGAGFSGQAHLQSLRRLGVELVALAGASPAEARTQARAHGVHRAFGDWREMLARADFDVLHVCTPPALHYPIVEAALMAGRHVVCEKPLTLDPRLSARLAVLAARKRRAAAVNFNVRYYAAVAKARALVRTGELGRVLLVHGSYLQDFHVPETPWGWRFEPRLAGSMRAVTEVGSHWFDLATHLTGLRVKAVNADLRTFHAWRRHPRASGRGFQRRRITSEDYAGVLLAFEGGAAGTLTLSEVSPGRKNQLRLEVVGAQGTLAWDSERADELWIGRKEGRSEVVVSGFPDGFVDTFERLQRDVYGWIRRPERPPTFPTFKDGAAVDWICQAVARSARLRRWVEVGR